MNRMNILSFVVKELSNKYNNFKLESVTIHSDGTGTGKILLCNEQLIQFAIKLDPARIEY